MATVLHTVHCWFVGVDKPPHYKALGLSVIPPSSNFWENWLANLRGRTCDVENIDDVIEPSERPWDEVFT